MVQMGRILYLLIILIFNKVKASDTQNRYGGEKFPLKFLSVEEHVIESDIDHFIKSLEVTLAYFNSYINETDVNLAVSSFFTKSILKRTLRDYSEKINKYQRYIRKLINTCENILSHYMYERAPYGWDDFDYKVSRIFVLDDSQIYTIGDFNRNRLKEWIITKDNNINIFLKQMDEATLPRDEYYKLSYNFKDFNINIISSDYCISEVSFNKEPIDFSLMQKCRPNAYCDKRIYGNGLPSIAYTLSHRLLNLHLRHSIKRCYIESEEADKLLMDQMCANMYRESVYLARRGFYARDMFLEHVALCSLLGYEEFHRKNWYFKATSWIKEEGCIVEDRNFILNSTKRLLDRGDGDLRKRKKYHEYYCKAMTSECDDHPTALLLVVLAEAIRYTAHVFK